MEIRLTEVGPRDGLQNERDAMIATADKVAFVNALSNAGFPEIEVSSFVSPKWVPQLADAADVFAQITRREGTVYSALVPNMRGLDAALASKVDKVSVFTAASESFCQKNINATIAESIERFVPVVDAAHDAGLPVRGYVSCVIACPYDGPTAPSQVADVVQRLLAIGIDEIDLGDTIGVGVPADINAMYDAVAPHVDPAETTLHMHDTRGTGLACVLRAIEAFGVRSFDVSCGGLGGCPYAPGAAGNLASEDVAYALSKMNMTTGVDLDALIEAGRLIQRALGPDRTLPGRAFHALSGDA